MSEQPRVLVIDDDPFVRRFLAAALEAEGYVVTTADDGAPGLDLLRDNAFEVVISDIQMPGVDGLSLIAALKEVKPDLPIVVLSGTKELDVVIEAMKRGASDYLLKDDDVTTTVILSVQKALEKSRLTAQNRLLTEQVQRRNEELEELNQKNAQLVEQLQGFNEELERKVRGATAEIRYRLTESTALNEVAAAISSVMEVQPLLEMIMEKSKQVINAEASSLMLLDEERRELVFHVATGEKGEAVREIRLRLGQGIAGWVAQTGEPLVVADAYQDPRFNPEPDKKSGFRTKSILCVPLKMQERILGIVQVINSQDKESFDEDDLLSFTSFAHHAAIAIENARLYEEIKRKAEELRQALERERWLTIQRDKLGKYVPEAAIEEIERGREQALASPTRTVECSILFSDIQGFTRIAENTPPSQLVCMLNTYHSEMHAVIKRHGGMLDKFIGDGIMVLFLPKGPGDNNSLRAVHCGMDMQRAVFSLDTDWVAKGLGELRVRIGVNRGEVISGSIGAETRMDYTVIGDNVNVASRLESNARAGEVMISESVYEQVKDHVQATRLQPIQVKNRVLPVQPYSIAVRDEG